MKFYKMKYLKLSEPIKSPPWTDTIHYISTMPYDWLHMLCPLEEAMRLREGDPEAPTTDDEIIYLVKAANKVIKEPLREPMRILTFPEEASYLTVLLVKVDNNGTCYWFSFSPKALMIIKDLMGGYDLEE